MMGVRPHSVDGNDKSQERTYAAISSAVYQTVARSDPDAKVISCLELSLGEQQNGFLSAQSTSRPRCGQ